MPGGWQAYRCDRCPLVIELGGFTAWGEPGEVVSETKQVACAACGTLHRVTDEGGACTVTALPGPIRASRPVTRRDVSGQEIVIEEWFEEADWRPVGSFPGGAEALNELACSHCGIAGRMLTLATFLFPGGYVRGAPRREICPVCMGPMDWAGLSDAV